MKGLSSIARILTSRKIRNVVEMCRNYSRKSTQKLRTILKSYSWQRNKTFSNINLYKWPLVIFKSFQFTSRSLHHTIKRKLMLYTINDRPFQDYHYTSVEKNEEDSSFLFNPEFQIVRFLL